ncbi:hypothetical protein [Bradyrhizobium japonicum]|uniref:hypothetical protein n=1 Tax=Bradyrhizobium japonicum TaxID=375 RepID=UPI00200FB953|nr:hypothetical protein [Bradyrhizobium japonicum]UQE03540.1 hypothetical protein JEY30_47200 [Bradyrhizobium japonicum]
MTMSAPQRPYTADDLLAGVNPWDPMGFTLSQNFVIYCEFATIGGPLPALASGLEQATLDAAISDALRIFLKSVQRPLVRIMGGHSLPRNHAAYAAIIYLARVLARECIMTFRVVRENAHAV